MYDHAREWSRQGITISRPTAYKAVALPLSYAGILPVFPGCHILTILCLSHMDQYKGFEPSPTEWKSVMLPLHQYWITQRFLSQPCINIIPRFSRKIKFLHTQTYKLKLWFEVAARNQHFNFLWPRSKKVSRQAGVTLEVRHRQLSAFWCMVVLTHSLPIFQHRGAWSRTRTCDKSGMNRPLYQLRYPGIYMLATAPRTPASTPINKSGAGTSLWKANPLVSSV